MSADTSSRLCAVVAALVVSTAGPAMCDWPPDGLPICTATDDQNTPKHPVPDGEGGTIFFWFDRRSPARDAIYAQRVDAHGSLRWGVDGVAIRGENVSNSFDVSTDGNGGAFVAWVDLRNGDSNPDIYAQRVDGNGTLLWGNGGAPVCTSTNVQYYPHLTYDGFGGVAVVWEDYGNGKSDIFAQRLDPSGDPYWARDGVPVCTVAGTQDQGQGVSDGNGGIIVAWIDARSETVAVYAQRLSFYGTPRWTRGGVIVSRNVRNGQLESVISDAMGGAILVWDNLENFGDSDVFAQRIDASGAKLWQPEGVIVCNASFVQNGAEAVEDGAGGALIAWEDGRTAGDNIYAQRLDAQGLPLWAANGTAVCTAPGHQHLPGVVPDGTGGCIVAWTDSRDDDDIYAQRIDATGAPRWTQDGAPVSTAPNHQWLGGIVADGMGGAVVVWDDGRDQSTNGTDIYAARVNLVTSLSLSELSATTDQGGVRLTWKVSGSVRSLTAILVQRAGGPAGDWATIARLAPETTSYLDPWSAGGDAPWYRLLLLSSEGVSTSLVVQAVPPAAQTTLDPPRLGADGVLIRFTLAQEAHVRLRVHDARGRLVRTLDSGNRDRGSHLIVWDPRGSGGSLARGVYVLRLESGGVVALRKLPLLH